MSNVSQEIIDFITSIYSPNQKDDFIPLHAPVFQGNEKEYLNRCIDTTFVSSVGEYVNKFEDMMQSITGAKYAVATASGTVGLHLALKILGIEYGDLVITQSLSFVATANAIAHTVAAPIFCDVDIETFGLSSKSLKDFLSTECTVEDGQCIHKDSKKKIKACVPMHTFGFLCDIEEIISICKNYFIPVVEDAAESLGSYRISNEKKQHSGTFGEMGVFSFNGNKIVTSGGGGCIVTNNEEIAKRAKHLSTTAKLPHPYEFYHDEVGYNYRLTNLSAALACAQLEQLDGFLENKRKTAKLYKQFFESIDGASFLKEKENQHINYWLMSIMFVNHEAQQEFLKKSNKQGVMTRPFWRPLHTLPMYKHCISTDMKNTLELQSKVVSVPSSVRV